MRTTLAALVAPLLLTVAAQAQPVADHLRCYKVKDSQPKASYTADVGGLVAGTGCFIKVPGNLFCTEATKANVVPTPGGGADNSGPAGRFLCYKLKCPKATVVPFEWHDQFGDRQLTPSTSKLVCAPEIVATTTTTTSTTTTTTLQGNGTACSTASQCGSGFCADGVCCNTACSGVCTACIAAETGQPDGACAAVPAGTDPNNDCAMTPASTCGTNGLCNGMGACELYPAGTTCAAPSCNAGTQTSAGTCDGAGTCDPGAMSSCSPYVCGPTACKTSCATGADCAPGFGCSAGNCVVLGGSGAPCVTNSQCLSNVCTANHCQ